MAQSSNVVLHKRIFIFLLRVGESIVWSIFAWIWEICWEWRLGSLSVGFPGSLSTSPFPSKSGLLWPVITGVSCSSFSCVVMFSVPIIFNIFFYILSSFVLSLFIFFYPHRLLFCFLNSVSSSVHNPSFGIVYLYVEWVTGSHDSPILDITHLEACYCLLGIWALFPHRFIHHFTPNLYYGPSHKTTLRPWDVTFASTYFIRIDSVYWLKYWLLLKNCYLIACN